MNTQNAGAAAATDAGAPPVGLGRGLLIAILFLFSGASALMYEVVWTRQLQTLFGATVYAVATVLTAFMGGLALGSWLIGRRADRMRRPLVFFGLLEAGIAVSALAFPFLLDLFDPVVGTFYATGGESTFFLFSLVRFVIAFLLLMIPTTLMGATLPVMTRAVARDFRGLGHVVGGLYALNTLGAVLGVFLTGFVLLELLGIWRTTVLAAGIDLTVALLSILVGWTMIVPPGEKAVPLEPEQKAGTPLLRYSPRLIRIVLVTYFFSGLAALAWQVAWTRSLLFGFEALKATTYSFSGMLTVFLLGLAIGSAVMQSVADRIRDPLGVYALVLFLIGASGTLSVFIIKAPLPMVLPEFDLAVSGDLFYWNAIGNVMLRTALAIGVPTLLMGAAFPLVARIVVSSTGSVGRDVGQVYAVNTLGAICGAFLGGFLLIPAFGITVTIGVLAMISFILALVLILLHPALAAGRRPVAAVVLVIAAAAFTGRLFFGAGDHFFHELVAGESMVYYDEGPLATVSVIEDSRGERTIYVDAIGVAGTDEVLQTDQKTLAHVPMVLLGGQADAVLTVGFGAGGASWSYSLYPDVQKINAIEITTNVPTAARTLTDANHGIILGEDTVAQAIAEMGPDAYYEGAAYPLAAYQYEAAPGFLTFDPRYRLIIDDARSYLRFTDQVYDVIATDCTDLRYKSNANLYDLEYFELCKDRISEDGLVVVWMPLAGLSDEAFRIVARTFQEVFPEMSVWYFTNQPTHYCLFIGQKGGVAIDYNDVERALEIPAIRADMESIGLADAEKVVASFVSDERGLTGYVGGGPLNTEDFPIVEFLSPRYGYDSRPIAENMGNIYDVQVPVWDLIERGTEDTASALEAKDRIARSQQANDVLFQGHVEYRLFNFMDAAQLYAKAREITPEDESIDRLLEFEEVRLRLRDDLARERTEYDSLWLNAQWLAFSMANVFNWQERWEDAINVAAPFVRRLPSPSDQLPPEIIRNGIVLNNALAVAYEGLGNERRAGEYRSAGARWEALQ